MMKTKDLENLVKPYSSQGVSIRWVDDSTALAVFCTPALARQALAGIHDPRFKVQRYSEGSAMISRSSQNGYFLTNLCTACESCCFCFRG
jgi:hypothetical protein